MEFITDTPGIQMTVRSPGEPVREVELGETLALQLPVASVALVSSPEGTPPIVDGLNVTPQVTGLHRFLVTSVIGERCELYVFCFEPACIDRVPEMQSSGRSSPRNRTERRLVIRALVNHHSTAARWFDGTRASMIPHSLAAFGA
jgi:hypothetical protein